MKLLAVLSAMFFAYLGWFAYQELGERGMKCKSLGGSYYVMTGHCVKLVTYYLKID
jgi:hypothetical protein